MTYITGLLLLIGCSCHVFATVSTNATVHNVIGVASRTNFSTNSTTQDRLLNYGVSLVRTNFTSAQSCKTIIINLLQNQSSVAQLCQILCKVKGALWEAQSCNPHDYDLLKNGLCGNYTCRTSSPAVTTPEQVERQRMNVQCVIDNQLSSDFCRQAVHGQVEQDEDPIRSCNILRSFHAAMGAFSCTTQDYNTLLKVICDRQTVACSEISSLIKTLASSCSATMNASALELTGPNACKYVESAKELLLQGSTCTRSDFAKVHFLVCHANASVNEAVSYGERVTRAETIMMTKLSDGCRVAISPAYLKNTLDEFCQMVNSAAFSMVQQSVCNISDYTYLTTAMCISNPESIIQDDKLRRDFRELVATLSVKCKDAMFYFEKPDTEENISDACKKLTKFSENLIVTMTCSEREIIRISKLLCNSANTLRLSWVISLAAYVGVIQFHLFTSTSLGRLHSIL